MAIRVHFPLEAGKAPEIGLAKAMRVGGSAGVVAPAGPEYSKYDRLNAAAPHFFESVDIDQADVIVYPYFAHTGEKTEAIANEARKRGIDCVFMSWGDEDVPVHVPHGTVYRHSLYSDHRVAHEFAMPAEVSDPEIETGSGVWPREWQEVPTIGFCGFVSNPFMRAVYRLSGRVRKVAGLSMRARVLRSLRRSKGIKPNLITRQLYWAGTEGRYHHHVARKFGPARLSGAIYSTPITRCASEAEEIFHIGSTRCWRQDGFRCSSTRAACFRSTTKSIGAGIASGSRSRRWTVSAKSCGNSIRGFRARNSTPCRWPTAGCGKPGLSR